MHNKLIFGKDTTEGIVNITLKNDKVHLYKEDEKGVVTSEIFPYSPFVLSAVKLKNESERLKGDQYYKYITTVSSEKFEELQQKWNRDLWLPRQAEEAFTLCEGVTYFKGRKVKDISILSFDIETSGLKLNNTSKVFLISNTFRRNGEIVKKLFSLEDYSTDAEMIYEWSKWVRQMDPSILCGHNILSYDLPYIAHVLDLRGSDRLQLGRDGSAIEFDKKVSRKRKDGSQQYEYHNARITGREIIDTFFLSLSYDIGRNFPSYGLKPIIKYLGMEKEGRSFVDASKISTYFDERGELWTKTKAYAEDDSDDSLKLYDLMIPAYFYLAQSIPKTLQQMVNEASGSQLDSLMIRSYLQDGYSQPRTAGKTAFEGAVSMGIPGKYDYVAKADIASLYPSVMLQYDIYDKQKDPDRHMLQMLEYFRTERLTNKRLAKETGDKYYDDMQNAQKIMINSMYGFMGASFLLYNYPKGAAAVTRHGREILLKGVEWATGYTLEKTIKDIVNEGTDEEEISFEWKLGQKVGPGRGYTLVNVDTDSFSITNNSPLDRNMFASELKELNALYPDLIRWEDDGIYDKVIVIRAKNYVLVRDGKIKYKGSAMTDQKKEPALTEMLENMVKCILADEASSLWMIYNHYVKEAMDIQDINRWSTKKTVTASVLVASDPDARAHERKVWLAMQEVIDKNIQQAWQEGDKLWVYEAIDGEVQEVKKGEPVFYKDGTPKMIMNRVLRDRRLWNKDQNGLHYVKRVLDTAYILENVINIAELPDYTLKSNRNLLLELTFGG